MVYKNENSFSYSSKFRYKNKKDSTLVNKTDALIVGAGPCGLFQVFELGLLGIKAHIVDALESPGGQCIELYPDKPIYDIPAIPVCDARDLVDRLLEQIDPFEPTFHLDQQVTEIEKIDERSFLIKTTKGTEFESKSVIIAGGVGSFQPMPLRVEGAEHFIDKQIFYRVRDPKLFSEKDIVVLGGGDSALDWVIELAQMAKSLTLIHRSEKFRAAPASVQKMRELEEAGIVKFIVGNITNLVPEDGQLKAAEIRLNDKSTIKLSLDHLLVFFGLSPKLGPIATWGIDLEKIQIPTNTHNFQTNIPGIYATGDIATYPGKKKLILSGFHEAALAAFGIKERIFPDQKVHLQYTTTSPIMHERLGVKS